MKKLLLSIILLLICYICLPQIRVNAASHSSSSYDVKCTFLSDKDIRIEYFIKLINRSDKFFIRDYSLVVEHSDIMDLEIKENGVNVDFRKEHLDNKVKLRIILQRQLVNKGDKSDLYISYNTRQLNRVSGLLTSLYIPPIKTEEDLDSATFTLLVPSSLGEISYNSPIEADVKSEDNINIISYNQNIAPYGALLHIGKQQQFDFVYTFTLENNSKGDKLYKLNLPVESPYQEVYFLESSPMPSRILTDLDGNIVAEYLLSKGEEKEIRITGFIIIKDTYADRSHIIEKIDHYIRETSIWDFSSEKIRTTINSTTKTELSDYENANLIYDFIITNFDLSEAENREVKKASELMESNTSLTCSAFQDLFITIARGTGIPAREVTGYKNDEVIAGGMRNWSEFYDKSDKRWIAVDPCIRKRFNFDGFDIIDLDRVILLYISDSSSSNLVIQPFVEYTISYRDNLEIIPSNYEYSNDDEYVDLDFSIGNADILFRNIPITFNINNNSRRIFIIDEVLVNGQQLEVFPSHKENGYTEAVFPGDIRSLSMNIMSVDKFSVEKIENYSLDIFAYVGDDIFEQHERFSLDRPLSFIHIGAWFIAAILSILTIVGFFIIRRNIPILIVKKFPKFQFIRRRRSYKYPYKKSKLGEFLNP